MADDLSWDDESFEPAAPVVAKPAVKGPWDEEEEEEDTKESWEEEEKPKPATPSKPKKKAAAKKAEVQEKEEPLADPVAEKLRQQRLVEEADYQATKELFGGSSKEVRSLDDFIPKTEAEFLEYADLIASKIIPFSKSYHYMTLLKQLARKATESLKGDDTKALASSITVIANEKLKAEKEAAGKKKATGKKKTTLHVDNADDDYRNLAYDDNDDYDFM